DRVYLFNGDGRQYPAEVCTTAKRHVCLQVLGVEAPARELAFRVEVAAPIPKGDRGQFLVEKLTELGATSFVPLCTARSIVQPRAVTLDRLRRYVIEASKQCGRNFLMRIEPPVRWGEYCAQGDLPQVRLLAHPGGTGQTGPARRDCAITVGPEGGFTDEELERARSAQWQLLDLGPRILRIETAALALVARVTSI